MNQLVLDYVVFNFRELMSEINSLFSMQISLKSLRYTCTIDDSVPNEICSDPNRIRQVILNLVGNAIKHNTDSGRLDFVVTRGMHGGGDSLRVEVTDTGEGMTQAQLRTLFTLEEIVNEANANKRISVSLPIAYQICKLLGGELEVRTSLGIGSTFIFHILINKDMMPKERASSIAFSNLSEECNMRDDSEELLVIQKPLVSRKKNVLSREELHHAFTQEDDTKDELTSSSLPQQITLLKAGSNAGYSITLKRLSQRDLRGCTATILEEFSETSREPSQKSALRPESLCTVHAKKSDRDLDSHKRASDSIEPMNRRSLSNTNVVPKELGKQPKQAHRMNSSLRAAEKMTRQMSVKDFVRKTLMRDPKAIRKNAIMTKNSLFFPTQCPGRAGGLKRPRRTTGIIEKVRNDLFEFQQSKDNSAAMYHASQSPPSDIPAESIFCLFTPFLVTQKDKQLQKPRVKIPRPKVLLRHTCMISPAIPLLAANIETMARERKESSATEQKPQTNEEVLVDMARNLGNRLRLKKCLKPDCADILVIDDNEFNRYIMVQLLQKYGFVCKMVRFLAQAVYNRQPTGKERSRSI